MKKVIIIGGGPAGLTAGYELLKKSSDFSVTILDQSDTLGGISKTVKYNGNRMDIGGHRFFSKDKDVTDFWLEMMPAQGSDSVDDKLLGREKKLVPGGPDPEKDDRVMLQRQRISRIYYMHKFFDYPISMKPQTFINMGLSKTLKAGFSYLKSTVSKKEETSLENFYINCFGKVLYSMFFEGYTEKLWGRHPSEIDASWGAQRTKGLSILGIIKDSFEKIFNKKNRKVNTSLIEAFYYPKFGPGQLWEAVGEEFEKLGGKIIYGSRVTDITIEGSAVKSVCCENGESLDGDYFLSSMPLKDLVEGMGEAVPEKESAIAAGLPYRDFVTVGLLVNKLNLKNETDIKTLGDIVPDCWIYVQDVGVKLGRIQIFNNWSPYLVKDPLNTVWVGLEYFCTEGDSFWNMTEADCTAYAIKELKSMGVIDESTAVLDSHRERVQKAYPAYFDTYSEIDTLTAFLDKYENLFCIGRNGQHRYNNMDHSMATAFEAVNNILNGKTTKENIWSVNTEAEYHEEEKSDAAHK